MRVLQTSDLHANLTWFDWVTRMAPSFDLVVIAGDLLRQGMRGEGPNKTLIDHSLQIPPLKSWVDDYVKKTKTPLAISSGNHDQGSPETDDSPAILAGEPLWEHMAQYSPQIVLDGESRLVWSSSRHLDGIWVTVAPFHWDLDHTRATAGFRALEHAAKRIAEGKTITPWLLVHHRPPPGALGTPNSMYSDEGLIKWLDRHPVDFVFSGHDHDQPSDSGTHIEAHGNAWCINAGQIEADSTCPVPNHTVLDTKAKSLYVFTKGGMHEKAYNLKSGASWIPKRS